MSARTRSKRQSNLPAYVQGKLKQEERMLEQTLDHLVRETANTIRTISQEQQVMSSKLKVMENRLVQSQIRSNAILHPNNK
uniref:Uncharacterized protein n=1 Tax=Amphimedon queenslandica TaxID=400682 RepID=A0A1X7VAR8_AMPQE